MGVAELVPEVAGGAGFGVGAVEMAGTAETLGDARITRAGAGCGVDTRSSMARWVARGSCRPVISESHRAQRPLRRDDQAGPALARDG